MEGAHGDNTLSYSSIPDLQLVLVHLLRFNHEWFVYHLFNVVNSECRCDTADQVYSTGRS